MVAHQPLPPRLGPVEKFDAQREVAGELGEGLGRERRGSWSGFAGAEDADRAAAGALGARSEEAVVPEAVERSLGQLSGHEHAGHGARVFHDRVARSEGPPTESPDVLGIVDDVDAMAPDEIVSVLGDLPGWSADGVGAIVKQYEFTEFSRAIAFMTAAAIRAERMDHHPEWSNVYRRVNVRLSTHSARGVTDLDVQLARYMDEIATGLGA